MRERGRGRRVSPGGLLVNRRKKEVAGRSARELHAGACLVEEETKGFFAHSPLDFGKNLEDF
jgi:hypothetical protein